MLLILPPQIYYSTHVIILMWQTQTMMYPKYVTSTRLPGKWESLG